MGYPAHAKALPSRMNNANHGTQISAAIKNVSTVITVYNVSAKREMDALTHSNNATFNIVGKYDAFDY